MIVKIREYLFLSLISIWPIFYGKSLNLRVDQERFFQGSLVCLIGLFVGNIWISAFILLNMALYVYQGCVGSNQVMNIFLGGLLFMVSRWFFKKNGFALIRKPVIIVVVLNIIFIILQYFKLDPLHTTMSSAGVLEQGPYHGMDGLFCIKMASGIYNIIVMPIIAMVNPILAMICLLPIAISQSSAVVLAFVCTYLFFTYYLYKRIFKISLIIIPIVGFIFIATDLKTDPKTFISRFPVWHMTARYALLNPIGYGPDSFRNYTNQKNFMFKSDGNYNPGILTRIDDKKGEFKYYSMRNDKDEIKKWTDETLEHGLIRNELPSWDNPHNEYLQVLFQYGIIGVVLLIGFLYEIFMRFRYSIKDREIVCITTCLLAYFITSICHFPFELARLAYLFPIVLGAFYAKTDKANGGYN